MDGRRLTSPPARFQAGGPFHVKEPTIMSTPRPTNETPAERAERLTRARASAARWEAYFRSLGGLPPREEEREEVEPRAAS